MKMINYFMKHFYLIVQLSVCFSCDNRSNSNNPFDYIPNSPNNEQRIRQDTQTKLFYYRSNPIDGLFVDSTTEAEYEYITDKYGHNITDLDLNSLKNLNSVMFDKTYFLSVEEFAGSLKITAQPLDSVIQEKKCFYFNSRYVKSDNFITYFGSVWNDTNDSTISCGDSIRIAISANDRFHVINENSSLNAYAVLNDEFLFHGCFLNIEYLPKSMRFWLLKTRNEQNFAKEYCIEPDN